MSIPDAERERFYTYVTKTDTCWHWLRPLRNGYGGYRLPSAPREENAHRVCWRIEGRQPLAPRERLINACGTKGCVRPEHQQVVAQGVNKAKI